MSTMEIPNSIASDLEDLEGLIDGKKATIQAPQRWRRGVVGVVFVFAAVGVIVNLAAAWGPGGIDVGPKRRLVHTDQTKDMVEEGSSRRLSDERFVGQVDKVDKLLTASAPGQNLQTTAAIMSPSDHEGLRSNFHAVSRAVSRAVS